MRLLYSKMNYTETLDFLYTKLPMFSRQGASAIKKDLTNTLLLCEALDNPHKKFKTVHVAGTNGKGSVSHMLAAILQTAGYKTGLYTSPHLKDFRERIRINGEMIAKKAVVNFVRENMALMDKVQPSFFELTVALAFAYFAHEKVDIAIIETGLGGRLDSTNVITPVLSIITNIGHDHLDLLGNTMEKVATEKAGIIKSGIPVIVGEKQDDIAFVFEKKAAEMDSPVSFASDEWLAERSQMREAGSKMLGVVAKPISHSPFAISHSPFPIYHYQLDLPGLYQLKNLATVLSAVFALNNSGYPVLNEQLILALKNVKGLTGLQGRWQTLSHNPLTITDTGHNAEGIQEVIRMIETIEYTHLHIVLGMVNDKDHSAVLNMLPKNGRYYFCRPNIPRGLDAQSLQIKAESSGLHGQAFSSVKEAVKAATASAIPSDFIFIGGSTFVVAEVV